MFGRKRKPVAVAPAPLSLLDALFADGPLESWPVGDHADRDPSVTSVTARRFVAAEDIGNAAPAAAAAAARAAAAAAAQAARR